ncbi:hypothetical protein II941_02620 [bacterium]|nr:hypothetical protein [bacterium]
MLLRDQVLISFFFKFWLLAITFFQRLFSTKRPFELLRDIYFLLFAINAEDAFFGLRVLTPMVRLPHGVRGASLPIGCLPSPPPCG